MNNLILAFCLLASPALAQVSATVGTGKSVPYPARLYPASPTPHNHPASPLLYEDFENASGYDLAGWSEFLGGGSASVNEDYTAVVLRGTQSLRISNDPTDGGAYTTNSFTANGHVWAYMTIQINGFPSGVDMVIAELRAVNDDCIARIAIPSGEQQLMLEMPCGTPSSISTTYDVNATLHVWLEYNKDNGANSFASLAFSTTGTRPTSGANYVDLTSTTSAVDVSRILLGQNNVALNPAVAVIYDHVLVDDVQIGDYP